jgi:hypothetical protein
MTFIGKFFVLINVAISVVMVGVGVGLFMTRSDWTEAAAKGTSPEGQLVARKAALKEAEELIAPARRTLVKNTEALDAANKKRATAQAEYGKSLKAIITDATDANPSLQVKIDKASGLPVVKPDGTLEMEPAKEREGGPLASIAWYRNKLEGVMGLYQRYLDERARFVDITKKDIAEAEKLAGAGGLKGLLERTQDEQNKEEGLREEIQAIAPPLELKSGTKLAVSAKQVDAAILEARLKRLDQQIVELEKTLERLKKLDGAAP